MIKIDIHALIKVGKKENIADLQEIGSIFMNKVGFFRDYEEKQLRGDKDEGIKGIHQIARLEILHPKTRQVLAYAEDSSQLKHRDGEERGYIYSLIAIMTQDNLETVRIDERNKEFGDSFVIICDVPEFIRRVEEEFKNLGYEYRYGPVQYYDQKEYSGELDIFCKQNYFKFQQEFRFFVKKNENDPLTLKIGSIEDISRVFDVDMLDKINFNVSKCGGK